MRETELARQFICTCEMKFKSAPEKQREVFICTTPEQLIRLEPGKNQSLEDCRFVPKWPKKVVFKYQERRQRKKHSQLLQISEFFLSPDFARENMEFDIDHPVANAVYVENPCYRGHYVLPALINERLAQEKLAAFFQIAQSLGAKKISIESGETVRTKSNNKTKITLPQQAAQIGLSASFDYSNKVNRQVCGEFDQSDNPPQFPDKYHFWLHMDPLLRALVETRLRGGVRHYQVCLNFQEMIHNAADLTVQSAALNLQAGGEYRHVQTSKWFFQIEFW